MSVSPSDLNKVYRTLCQRGLKMSPSSVPAAIAQREQRTLRKLLGEVPTEDLINAIEWGMPNVWPFSEDGRPFDAKDLERNLIKALGESSRRERRGEIPYNAQKIKR